MQSFWSGRRLAVAVSFFAFAGLVVWWASRGASGETAAVHSATPAFRAAPNASGALALARAPVPEFLLQAGVAPVPIAGIVTIDGAPAAGVPVVLTSVATDTGSVPSPRVLTGDDGHFEFGMRPALHYVVAASAPGRAPAVVKLDARDPTAKPASDELELRLGPCDATIRGVVRDGSGGVVEGARVGPARGGSVRSGADGSYSLCTQRGRVRIEIGAAGYGTLALNVAAFGEVERDVVLVPEATLVGRVVRELDQTPVPMAAVYALPVEGDDGGPAHGTGLADGRGQFSIAGLAPGRYRLFARAEGLTSAGATQVVLEAGRDTDVTLALAARAPVRGRVVRGDEPVAGVHVGLTQRAPTRYSTPAVSQADGSFAIDDAPIGEVLVTARGFKVVSPASVTVSAHGVDELVVQVTESAGVHGTVLFEGRPVEGARVSAGVTSVTNSGADGHYQLDDLGAGAFEVEALSESVGAFGTARVALREGERKVVDVSLANAARISGIVRDQSGAAIAGAWVEFELPSTGDYSACAADAVGAFTCDSMTGGGSYRPRVFASATQKIALRPVEKGGFESVELADGGSRVSGVVLHARYERLAIAGRVVDASGEPVMDARVVAAPIADGGQPRFSGWEPLPFAISDQQGGFEIRGLADGPYGLRARHPSAGEGTVVQVRAGARNVELHLSAPGAIAGTLVGFTATPSVYVQSSSGERRGVPATVTHTGFRASGLVAGEYIVSAQTAAEGAAKLVRVAPGETASVTMTSAGSGSIEGWVSHWGGDIPAVGMLCHLVVRAGEHHGTTDWSADTAPRTDEAGYWEIAPAPAGPMRVTCWADGLSAAVGDADVARGKRTRLVLHTVARAEHPGGAWIGADFATGTPLVQVAAVTAGGPASRAGLAVGDVLERVDGRSLVGVSGHGMETIVANAAPGTSFELAVSRRGSALIVTVVADSAP